MRVTKTLIMPASSFMSFVLVVRSATDRGHTRPLATGTRAHPPEGIDGGRASSDVILWISQKVQGSQDASGITRAPPVAWARRQPRRHLPPLTAPLEHDTMSSGDAELSREERGVITRNKDVLFQKSGRAPGVAKDEWQLIVNKKGVVLSQWIINPRVGCAAWGHAVSQPQADHYAHTALLLRRRTPRFPR